MGFQNFDPGDNSLMPMLSKHIISEGGSILLDGKSLHWSTYIKSQDIPSFRIPLEFP